MTTDHVTPEQFAATMRALASAERLEPDEERREKLASLNSRYAVINWHGRTLVVSRPIDPITGRRTLQLSSLGDFKSWMINRGRVGRQPMAEWWLEHEQRAQYEGVVFMPPGAGEAPGYLNLWQGWACEPRAGDCSAWLELVREVICSGDEQLYRYVVGWCADAVQNICERPGITLVLLGKQGTGKGTFAREFGALYGDHFLHLRNSRLLTGNFNAHLTNALMVFADEAIYPGDKQSEGALKGMITEPTIPIEFKGKDVVTVKNHIRVIMASNHEWVVPAALDDRRFCIIEVDNKHQRDELYFERVRAQMANGGREALLEYLMKFDLSGLRLREIPDTVARHVQQLHSMDPVQAFWFDLLKTHPQLWGQMVKIDTLFEQYLKSAGKFPLHRVAFGVRAHTLFPTLRHVRPRSMNREAYYCLPELPEARQQFAASVGRTFDWEAETAPETDDTPQM